LSIADPTTIRLTTNSQIRIAKATPSDPYVAEARSTCFATTSVVPSWIVSSPVATSSAPGTSARGGASPCGSRIEASSHTAKNGTTASNAIASAPSPISARARPTAAHTSPIAMTAATMPRPPRSGCAIGSTRPFQARQWTACTARTAFTEA